MYGPKYKPRIGDMIILNYYCGRRVGLLVHSTYKNSIKEKGIIIVWCIKWVLQENGNLPPEWISESNIYDYLQMGAAKIYKAR